LAVFTGFVGLHQRSAGLGDIEAADQVHHYGAGEILQRHRAFLAQHPARAEDARAVHHHVQAAHPFACGGNVGDDAILTGHVGFVEPCRVADLLCGGMAFFFVDVEQRDLAAVGDDVLRDRVAEPGCAAGDDGLDLIELHARISRVQNPRL